MTYKYNQAECNHQGKWDDAMFGKTCLDCGFNTLANDHGMYGPPMSNPKTCQFCKHWRSAGTGFAQNQPSDICSNPKIAQNFHGMMDEHDTVQYLTPIDGISCNSATTYPEPEQFIRTGREFGCIHFSPIN